MPIVPLLKPRQVVKTFEKLGWEVARQRGSHIILTKEGHIATLSVPNHPEVALGHSTKLDCKSGDYFRGILRSGGKITVNLRKNLEPLTFSLLMLARESLNCWSSFD